MNAKLGFGCMHLPLANPLDNTQVDIAELSHMVDMFIGCGFDYFDAAYTYHDGHCEEALRKALVERYPRESYMLADKLPTMLVADERGQEEMFARQAAACGVEYFDRYLVHCATEDFYRKAERLRSFDFVARKKREGAIRRTGFSFHDSPELLEEILTKHPDIDFVQLQVSYVDWSLTPIQARRCCETARRHGKPIVAMCPQKGGLLLRLPPHVERRFAEVRPDATPSDWALRYAASIEGVETVLSGMSSSEQMARNIASMCEMPPFTERERETAAWAAREIIAANPVQCTSCGYCLPSCPVQIPIPDCLALCETVDSDEASDADAHLRHKAAECIECGNCERACPQHIHVTKWLERMSALSETVQTHAHA